MKRLASLLLLIYLVGCHKEVAPKLPTNALLYRTWRLTQILRDGQPADYTRNKFVVTFPHNGNFFGNQSPDSFASCCSPIAFEGNNTVIRFIWDTSAVGCANVFCALSPLSGDAAWLITTLNTDSLSLTDGKTVLVFESK